MAKISRVSHVVLNVSDPEASAKWYSEALGMELMNYSPGLDIAFLSFGTLDHDIALVKAPVDAPLGSPGISHTAMSIEGGPPELKELYDQVKATGAKVEMTADHGLSKSFYFLDPDGNRLEIFYQALKGAEAQKFMREVGAMLEPYEELEAAPAD